MRIHAAPISNSSPLSLLYPLENTSNIIQTRLELDFGCIRYVYGSLGLLQEALEACCQLRILKLEGRVEEPPRVGQPKSVCRVPLPPLHPSLHANRNSTKAFLIITDHAQCNSLATPFVSTFVSIECPNERLVEWGNC